MIIHDKIIKIEDAVKVGKTFQYNWFRGHSSQYRDLTPRVFRHDFYSDVHNSFSPETESQIIKEFKRISPSLQINLPDDDNHLDWLILMQHFGTPTRLLDWSENILVALFFAVIDDPDNDGELWTIYPQELNGLSGIPGFPLSNHRYIKYLAGLPMASNPEKLKDHFEIDIVLKFPLAFFPSLKFPRMTSQQSVFTLHPEPIATNEITSVLTDKKHLFRYTIPKIAKQNLINELNCFGICFKNLFMDLDNLSKDIINKYKNPMWSLWGQPDPPNFNSPL
jgi:hypothetical protein